MDQLKEILRQAIKYRFWIAVGLSALFPLIAYFVGVGKVKEEAKKKTDTILASEKKVAGYKSPTVPTAAYKNVVTEKTDDLTKDVDETWKLLYKRQAPLLTWPDRVQERFTKWGRKWPDKATVDASAVQLAINDYVNVYPEFVTKVYKTFKPFNPEDGTGIVAAQPEAVLLRPSQFTIEAPPTLGKVWAAQERLWIQRTLLEVIAEVNKDAKDWDSAIVREILFMEVGNPDAQDQRSIANGDTLEEAPEIKDPDKPEDPAASEGGGEAGTPMAGRGAMPGMMPGMGMPGMAGGGAAGSTESVFYIKNDSTQFKILPVKMVVFVEQDKMQNFLVALENSPMTIQVMDFEMSRPEARVTKPEKGVAMMGMGGYGGMMGGDAMPGMGGMTGMGGMYSRMGGRGGAGGMMPGMEGMMQSMRGGAGGMGMPGMGGMGAVPTKTGVDKRGTNLEKEREKQIEAVKKSGGTSLHDPYYNIVQVTIYGQARFFFAPPVEAPAEPSQAEGTPAAAPAEGEAKAETPKAEAPKAVEPKAEAPKAEEPKAEAPKAEAPKAETAKEAPKAETPKTEAPKGDAATSK